MFKIRIGVLALVLPLFVLGCKRKVDCNLDPNDQLQLILAKSGTKQFPQLPDRVFVNSFLSSVGRVDPGSDYRLSNEQFFINGKKQDDLNAPAYRVGENTLSYTGDCRGLNTNREAECECGEGMKTTSRSFEVVDTVRIWIKKIEFWKQYNSPRPDVYLVINNFGNKSAASWNYDYAKDGKKVWNIDDTFTISKKYFNMSISVWDKDRVGRHEKVKDYFIKGDEVNNWAEGTQSYYKVGGFSFEIVKL